MQKEGSLISRRSVLKKGAGLTTAGAIGFGALAYSTQPAIAASMDVWNAGEDVSITTTNGTFDELIIDPEVTVEYANLDEDQLVEFRWTVSHEDESGSVGSNISADFPQWDEEDLTLDGSSGTFELDIPSRDMVHVAGFDHEHLFADDPGETNMTEIEVTLEVDVPDQEGIDPVEEADTFTVSVTNAEPEVTATGSSSTIIASDNETST